MNCLRIDQIYLFLERELDPHEYPSIQAHISTCEKCRHAVEERKRLVEASQSLSEWKTPDDFAQRILMRIFPKKIGLRDWIVTLSTGLASAVLAFFAVYLISGQTLADLFVNLNRTALNLFQNMIVLTVKAAKLISIGIQVLIKTSNTLARQCIRRYTLVDSPFSKSLYNRIVKYAVGIAFFMPCIGVAFRGIVKCNAFITESLTTLINPEVGLYNCNADSSCRTGFLARC